MLLLQLTHFIERTIRQIEDFFPAFAAEATVVRRLHGIPVHRAFEGKVFIRESVHKGVINGFYD